VLSIYSSEPPTNPRSNFAGEERLSGGAAPSARAGGRAAQEEGARGGHAEAGASPLLSSSGGREPRERGPAEGARCPGGEARGGHAGGRRLASRRTGGGARGGHVGGRRLASRGGRERETRGERR